MKVTKQQLRLRRIVREFKEALHEAPKKPRRVATPAPKRGELANKTWLAIKESVVDALESAGGSDENLSRIEYAVQDLGGKVDTSKTHMGLLLDDPEVQEAFRVFLEGMIGAFQVVGDE